MRISKHILPLFFLAFLLDACKKEYKQPSWETDLLAPLLKSTLQINDLLADSIIKENHDSSLKIVIENDLYNLDSIYQIPDTTLMLHYGIPLGTFTFSPGQIIINRTEYTKYKLGSVELGTIRVKSGFIKFMVRSEIAEVTDFIYKLPGSIKNGIPVEITAEVPPKTAQGPGIYTGVFDLSGAVIDLKGPTGNKVNTLASSVLLRLSPKGQNTTIAVGDSLSIISSFVDIVPDYAQGYFGSNTFGSGKAGFPFTLFNKVTAGSLKLEDFYLNLSLENETGVDLRASIDQFSSKNSRNNSIIDLKHTIIGSAININRATETGNPLSPVKPYTKTFTLNGSNSNITALIENLPDSFIYAISIITNPLGNISGSKDFVYHNRNLKTKLKMEFPLSMIATNLTLCDTSDINLSSVKSKNNIRDGILMLFANNGFPLDAQLQVYMLDASHKKTDSLMLKDNTIRSASVNKQFRVDRPQLTKLAIPITQEKLQHLFNAEKLLIVTKFNTTAQPQLIKIYSDYKIDFQLTANFNYLLGL